MVSPTDTLSNPRLCTHDELPSWCKDNAFIVAGYRRPGDQDDLYPDEVDEDDIILEVPLAERRSGESHKTELRRRGQNGKVISNGNGKAKKQPQLFRHDTVAKCWGSIWGYFHNETINIHSHLWGAVASILVLALHVLHHFSLLPPFLTDLAHHSSFSPPIPPHTSVTRSAPNDWKDKLGFVTFLLSSVTCLTFSSSFHTLCCHSHHLAHKFNKLDYVGIVVMIVGSFLPTLHYGFYCRPYWQLFYGGGIITLGGMATYVVLAPHYATPEYRPIRTAIFLALGLSAVIPVAHGSAIYGVQSMSLSMGLKYLTLEGTLYVSGALLYALRVPERFAKGKFDLLGASHQIFHIFILLAALSHYISLRHAYSFWHTTIFSYLPPSSHHLLLNKGEQDIARHEICRAFESM